MHLFCSIFYFESGKFALIDISSMTMCLFSVYLFIFYCPYNVKIKFAMCVQTPNLILVVADWSHDHLKLNLSRTKELVVDYNG